MEDRHSLGDTAPEEFRKQLHELADWIADFRENIEKLRVAPDDTPGAIRAQLHAQAPEEGEPFEEILSDVDRLIVPGMVHWSHPMFLGYFGWTATAPGILGEIISAPLNVNAMTWRTCPAATELETVVIDWLRKWVGLPEAASSAAISFKARSRTFRAHCRSKKASGTGVFGSWTWSVTVV